MLTRELAIAEYDGDRIVPDRLTRNKHRDYLNYAERLCDIYRFGIGRTRQSLHSEVRKVFMDVEDCPPRRMDAFCKLLDEASVYEKDDKGKTAALRQQVFRAAAKFHPLVENADPWFEQDETTAKRQIAESLNQTWPEIDRKLFADIIEFHVLKEWKGFLKPADLLARYNVAQVQVSLYDAISMRVWASQDFKTILRYAKLARLMHRIERLNDGSYRFDFDGPASILQQTHRYGVAMARFLPGLLSCSGWKLQALLKPTRWYRKVVLELDDTCQLKSPVPKPEEFDSSVEELFWDRWQKLDDHRGWTISRESEVLHCGQKVFLPDFVFQHSSGKKVFLEVIGYWTPEYLRNKVETLKHFPEHPMLLAVAESIQSSIDSEMHTVIPYKTSLKVDLVLDALR